MRRSLVTMLAVAGLIVPPAPAQQPVEKSEPKARPKVVLVLSGGGARGSAHIGVIKMLEAYHVPVDFVVGTSMGSIIGGLYASGWSIDEIEQRITTIDWGGVFVDKLPRQTQTFRRKSDDARFLVPIKMRFKGFKPYLPPAVIGGQNLQLLFQGLEIEATGERDFDKFPIPYRAIATDLSNGAAVIIGKGSLATAMRASMSVPGVFPPVELDGKPLSDGGLAANFPIQIARSLGADVIIGVDITTPLLAKEELGNLLTRLNQMSGLLTSGNREHDMTAVRPDDVILVPDLGDISFSDFGSAKDAIAAGEKAAQGQEQRLRALSVSDAEWAAFEARHHRRPASDLVVDEVRIKNTSPLADEIVATRIDVPKGQPLDESRLAPQLLRLYGLDVFSPITHDFVHEGGKGVLKIETPPKPYGANSLQFGFNVTDDFRGDVGFNLTVSHLMNPVNRKGGEWRNIGQLGENSYAASEFYQPLDAGMRWFVSPVLQFRRDKVREYDPNGNAVAEVLVNHSDASFRAGRVFGNWGDLAVGAFRAEENTHPKIGTPNLATGSTDDGGVFAVFRVDTLDKVTWPRDGISSEVVYRHSVESLGAESTADYGKAHFGMARSIGKNVLLGSIEASSTTAGSPQLGNHAFLGGLFNLSGLARNQLVGERGGIMRLLYYREVTAFDLGSLTQRMYVGTSLEGGNVYDVGDPVTWQSLRYSGSVYVGADTVVGPAYLGFGYAEGGRTSVYLIIGQRF